MDRETTHVEIINEDNVMLQLRDVDKKMEILFETQQKLQAISTTVPLFSMLVLGFSGAAVGLLAKWVFGINGYNGSTAAIGVGLGGSIGYIVEKSLIKQGQQTLQERRDEIGTKLVFTYQVECSNPSVRGSHPTRIKPCIEIYNILEKHNYPFPNEFKASDEFWCNQNNNL
jgi:hypothetical protein